MFVRRAVNTTKTYNLCVSENAEGAYEHFIRENLIFLDNFAYICSNPVYFGRIFEILKSGRCENYLTSILSCTMIEQTEEEEIQSCAMCESDWHAVY